MKIGGAEAAGHRPPCRVTGVTGRLYAKPGGLRSSRRKFERVTDESRILAALNAADAGSHYYVFTKDPSVQAFMDLMNRALDKPKEQAQEVAVSADAALVALLQSAQKRTNGREHGGP